MPDTFTPAERDRLEEAIAFLLEEGIASRPRRHPAFARLMDKINCMTRR